MLHLSAPALVTATTSITTINTLLLLLYTGRYSYKRAKPKIGIPRPFEPYIYRSILRISLWGRLPAPPRHWPTLHCIYDWLKTP